MAEYTVTIPTGPQTPEACLVPGLIGNPPAVFSHPREVLEASDLSAEAKREILASWVSDACAVEGAPAWRQLPGSSALVAVDDILAALQALDRGTLH
jgi:hypothetical protein